MSLEQQTADFKKYLERKLAYERALAIISWDQSTGAPRGGTESRGKMVGVLSGESFSMSISNEMQNHLSALDGNALDALDAETAAMLRICKRDYDAMANIPVEEFVEYSELLSNSDIIWEEAKKTNNFDLFAPYLEKIIGFQKRFIKYRGFEGHPYNTLLDDYEPGMTVEVLDKFFDEIKSTVVPLLKKLDTNKIERLKMNIPTEKQEQISLLLMKKLGFDFNRGMIKTSEHPFTSGIGKGDVRITTHYYEDNFLSSLYSVVHEVGHALYEQNTMDSLKDTILDTGISMGIHESQSRFYENILGRSLEFWENIYDELYAIIGNELKGLTPYDLYLASNRVEPSLIRTEADELTYSLHIMIRYELEKYIFSNDVDVLKLPELWKSKYKEYLGIEPDSYETGILQDVHWASGLFGYFPSYSLGNAYASQIDFYMRKEVNTDNAIKNGDYKLILDWLADKIHKYGSVKMPNDVIQLLSGESLSAKYYTDYLVEKYSRIYEIK